MLVDPGAQLALGDVLQVLVDRQLEAVTGGGAALLADRDRLLQAVGLQQDPAIPSADPAVVDRLDPGQSTVVRPDVTEQRGAQLPLRVVAAALLVDGHAGKVEREDAGRGRG